MDTIFSLSSAHGKAGVAIIRVSGSKARDSCEKIAGFIPQVGRPILTNLKDKCGEQIDRGLVLYFPEGSSFTGESTVEYHTHGSVAVIKKVLQELGFHEGHREALPGEFTRRALDNGKLDVSQIEGLSDLINAETEAQRKQAFRVFDGAIGKKVSGWRTSLIKVGSLLEAGIDFSDEEIPPNLYLNAKVLLKGIITDLEKEIKGSKVSERIRTGFEIAILGAPNVGKSTLINAIAGREAAITSEYAGTTRDVIEVRMDLNGLPVTFLDTAGIRETKDKVELIGIERALARAQNADLKVLLVEPNGDPKIIKNEEIDIELNTKSDLTGVGISGKTGDGIPELLDLITTKIKKMSLGAGVSTHERHRLIMIRAEKALKKCLCELSGGEPRLEIAADELRAALIILEGMIGSVGVEDFLDKIFADFCIGK